MANERADDIGKVTQDFAAVHDKASLHKVMDDLHHLKGEDAKVDKDETKGIFKQDIAQIAKSVDLKALGLDGFQVATYAEADNNQYLLALKPGAKEGDDPQLKIVDQNGVFYSQKDQALTATQDRAFPNDPAADTGPLKAADTPQPAKVADNGDPRGDVAPAAAPTDNTFGVHGRTFAVGADGKAVYPAKHGDTYWSVAKDLLSKPDQPAPTNAQILAQVNALATLNNKSDANKLMVGESIILPITPPPVDAKVPPTDAKVPPVDAKVPPTDAKVPPVDAKVPPTDAKVPPVDAKVPPVDAKVPPTDAKVPPTDAKVPPTDAKVPPTDAKTPPDDKAPKPPAPAAPAAPAATLGFDMKAHADALKPKGDSYSPLSPLGMSGAGADADKATLAGDVIAPIVKGTVTTQETDLNLKDGSTILFGYGRTGVKNVDTTDGNILTSRETTYDSGVAMKMSGPKGPIDLKGVTHIMTTLQANGMYQTEVTAGDGVYNFTTDSTGTVQRAVDPKDNVALLAVPTAQDVAALNVQGQPTAVADADIQPKVVAKPEPPPAKSVDVP